MSASGGNSDLFSRRFREGISFPNFVERSIPKLPFPSSVLSLLLYRTEQFWRGEKGEQVPRKGEEEGWPAKGAKRKKGRVKTGPSSQSQKALSFSALINNLPTSSSQKRADSQIACEPVYEPHPGPRSILGVSQRPLTLISASTKVSLKRVFTLVR